eukprot:TRINITY_DN67970_c0_g1_i1.p1 TRINITY_DN67970_c0_g1~~TRINITY_DN67970_c0_g1_i1.p1  ORF type:complete len:825 (-),score=96.07 TRINITY_DN67970_c0_g1_i1:230-2704(-)
MVSMIPSPGTSARKPEALWHAPIVTTLAAPVSSVVSSPCPATRFKVLRQPAQSSAASYCPPSSQPCRSPSALSSFAGCGYLATAAAIVAGTTSRSPVNVEAADGKTAETQTANVSSVSKTSPLGHGSLLRAAQEVTSTRFHGSANVPAFRGTTLSSLKASCNDPPRLHLGTPRGGQTKTVFRRSPSKGPVESSRDEIAAALASAAATAGVVQSPAATNGRLVPSQLDSAGSATAGALPSKTEFVPSQSLSQFYEQKRLLVSSHFEFPQQIADISTSGRVELLSPRSPVPRSGQRKPPLPPDTTRESTTREAVATTESSPLSPKQKTRNQGSPVSVTSPQSFGSPVFDSPRPSVSLKRTTTVPSLFAQSTMVTFAKSAYNPHCGYFSVGQTKDSAEAQPTPLTSAGPSSVQTLSDGGSISPRFISRGGGWDSARNGCDPEASSGTSQSAQVVVSTLLQPQPAWPGRASVTSEALTTSPRACGAVASLRSVSRSISDGRLGIRVGEHSGGGAIRTEVERKVATVSSRLRPPPLGDSEDSPSSRSIARYEIDTPRDTETNREVISPRGAQSPVRRYVTLGGSPRGSSPGPGFSRISAQSLKTLLCGHTKPNEVREIVTELLMEDLPAHNISRLQVTPLENERSKESFLKTLSADGGRWSRVRVTWHLASSVQAALAISREGIRCEEEHCMCGRYGRGGYVACSAAKANAYADSSGEGGQRALFLVLALPDEDVVLGERGSRPPRTAADHPSHPTEYCFVDATRLFCACLLSYSWVPTGRREKVVSAGDRVSHIVKRKRSVSPSAVSPQSTSPQIGEVREHLRKAIDS